MEIEVGNVVLVEFEVFEVVDGVAIVQLLGVYIADGYAIPAIGRLSHGGSAVHVCNLGSLGSEGRQEEACRRDSRKDLPGQAFLVLYRQCARALIFMVVTSFTHRSCLLRKRY